MRLNGGTIMNSLLRRKRVSIMMLGILAAALLTVLMPVQVYGDAAVEDFWNTAYSVDYDVTVAAPDGGVNIRYGPGTDYEKVQSGMIPNGTVLHIETVAKADNGKDWGQTQYGGNWGWVFLGQTKKVNASQPANNNTVAPSKPVPADYNVEVSAPDGGVNIRSGPGASYEKLQGKLIPNGTVLHISETAKADNGKDWGYTTYNGLKGWIFLGQTKTTSAAPAASQTQPAQEPAAADEPASVEEPQADVEPDVDGQPDSDALVEEDSPGKSLNTSMFTMAIIALVILAIIVAVVLLLARRNR